MMTDRDMLRALEVVKDKTAGKLMTWKVLSNDSEVELLGTGIPGYQIKLIEKGRSYTAKIANEIPGGGVTVVGHFDGVEHDRNDLAIDIEAMIFSLFREASNLATSQTLGRFEEAADQLQPDRSSDSDSDPLVVKPTSEVKF